MKEKYINMYMDWAVRVSQLSHARRLKVGAVIVKNDTVISYGYNGTPAGYNNNCEDTVYAGVEGGCLSPDEFLVKYPYKEMHGEFQDQEVRYGLRTKPEVLHAERNALDKLAKHGGMGGNNADLFVTHAPCLECAKSIYGAGIKKVYFGEAYRDDIGTRFLINSGVDVIQCKQL